MALVGYWKCDENGLDQVTTVVDSSGHANNHDFTSVGYYNDYGRVYNKFCNRYRRSQTDGDYHAAVNNNADFLLYGSMTICAWVKVHVPWPSTDRYFIGCGAGGTSEVQADNLLWSLIFTNTGRFGMHWENGAGVDVIAYSPANRLDVYAPAFQHIAVIRTLNAGFLDVKFVLDGVDLVADVTGLAVPDGGTNAVCEMLRLPGANTQVPNCNIANVRVYDTAETVGTINGVYTSELPEMQRLASAYQPQFDLIGNYPYRQVQLSERPIESGVNVVRLAIQTGSRLDQEERPNSGWAQVGS